MPADLLSPVKWLVRRVLRYPRLAQHIVVHAMGTPAALARIAARDTEIRTVIDVGASDGRWSLQAEPVWPDARFHLVEANPSTGQAAPAVRAQAGVQLLAGGRRAARRHGRVRRRQPFGGRAMPDVAARLITVPQRSLASSRPSCASRRPT